MKKIFFTLTGCALCMMVVSGCTNQPTSLDDKMTPSPASEPETTLVPVKQIDPDESAPTNQVLDDGITELDMMAKDLQSESYTDLPANLGQ